MKGHPLGPSAPMHSSGPLHSSAPPPRRLPMLHVSKAFYFFYYGAWACLLPFLALYYQSLGFSGTQIGVLSSIPPLANLIVAPLWGGMADATHGHKRVLLGGLLGAGLAVWIFSHVREFWLLAILVAIYAAFASTIIPLADNATLALLGDRRDRYGVQRLWGSIGWGIAAPVMGYITGRAGLRASFTGYLALVSLTFLAVCFLPIRAAARQSAFWKSMGRLLADRRWFLFLAIAFISGAGLAVVSNFLFLYMEGLHATRTMMGLALTAATISEIPVLFLSGSMIRRWGPHGLLGISLAAYVVRAYASALAVAPWQILVIQLLHGLTFSTMWVAGVSFAGKMAPPHLGATAQSLFSGTAMGLGGITGGLVGGVLLDHFGGPGMFFISGTAVLAGLVVFMVFRKRLGEEPPPPAA